MTYQQRKPKRKKRQRRGEIATSYKGNSITELQTEPLTKGTGMASNESEMRERFEITCEVAKVHDELGLVFGWAIVCEENGEPYFDLQEDHIPPTSMLKAATGFAKGSRMAKEMHVGGGRGTVVFLMPFTSDIAKSLGITGFSKTGLIIGMAPDAEMLAKFKSGELRGFSIGGRRIKDQDA